MSVSSQSNRENPKRIFWQNHIDNSTKSSLSQEQYCRRYGLALSTFAYWKKKLAKNDKKVPQFYPLTVQQVSVTNCQATNPGITLTFGKNNFRIELAENFSAGCLKQLIHTLEQL
jgi:hypothetical protein